MGLFSSLFGLCAYAYAGYSLVCYLPFWNGNLQQLITLPSFAAPFFSRSVDVAPNVFKGGINSPGFLDVVLKNTFWWSLFVLQHEIMARDWFKKIVTKIIPTYCERSLFVLASSFLLHNFINQWIAIPTVLWHIEGTPRDIIQAIQLAGWLGLVFSSFVIDHFDLFGVRQSLMAEKYTPVQFAESYVYKYVRHPLMLCFLIAFYSQPTMTLGHLVFNIIATAFIFLGLHFEERDLLASVPQYKQYMNRVPRLCPFLPVSGNGNNAETKKGK